jgi:hypothetical protein
MQHARALRRTACKTFVPATEKDYEMAGVWYELKGNLTTRAIDR